MGIVDGWMPLPVAAKCANVIFAEGIAEGERIHAINTAVARHRGLYGDLSDEASVANCGRRYRKGLAISVSRARGSVEDVGNAHVGKHRPMRWSTQGASDRAVTQAAVLEGRLPAPRQE